MSAVAACEGGRPRRLRGSLRLVDRALGKPLGHTEQVSGAAFVGRALLARAVTTLEQGFEKPEFAVAAEPPCCGRRKVGERTKRVPRRKLLVMLEVDERRIETEPDRSPFVLL